MIHGISQIYTTIQIVDSLHLYEEAFTRHLRSGRSSLVRTLVETRGTPPSEHSSTQTPSEISQRHALCSIFNHFPKVMKSSESCALTLATVSTLFFSDLLLRLDLGLHSLARLEILNPTLGEVRTKVQLLSLLDALYAEVFDCTRCRNLLA